MCTVKNYFKIHLGLVLFMLGTTGTIYSQDYRINNQESELVISGTSSLHDWDMTAEKQNGQLILEPSDRLKIQKLSIEITAEGLESGKNLMNKNTFKALKTDSHKQITFQLTEIVDIIKKDNGHYDVKSVGNLSVAGVTNKINLDFKMNVSDNKVVLKGEKSFKMTDFKIDPPKAFFGTIKTGDDITIKFNTVLTK